MKKVIQNILIFAFCCIASGFLAQGVVKADVIWQPVEDTFYSTHSDQCTYVNRGYKVNSASGSVTSYENPFSTVETGTYQNGDVLRIYYIYHDENCGDWGIIDEGWDQMKYVPMKELELVYDNISFCDEHRGEFAKYDDRLKNDTQKRNVVLWTYPNSGKKASVIRNVSLSQIFFSYLYTDENGYLWTYVSYYQLNKGWVCINDPETVDISTIATKQPVITETTAPTQSALATLEPTPTALATTDPVPTGTSTVGPTPTITNEPTPTVLPGRIVKYSFKTLNQWPGGFIGQIDVTNNTEADINGWTLTFDCKYKIESLWNAELLEQKDGKVKVGNPTWDTVLENGETQSFNFIVNEDFTEEPGGFTFSH